MKNEHEDPGSFGETTTPASGKSFLKRQYMGYSLPVWAGCVLIILAAVWYKFLRTPSEPPADAGFAVTPPAAESWAEPMPMTETGSGNTMSAPPVTPQADMQQLARDLKAELDRRDEEIRRTLTMLKESITTLGDTIRKDEAWHRKPVSCLMKPVSRCMPCRCRDHCKSRPGITASQRKPRLPACRACKSCRWKKEWPGSAGRVAPGQYGKVTGWGISPSPGLNRPAAQSSPLPVHYDDEH